MKRILLSVLLPSLFACSGASAPPAAGASTTASHKAATACGQSSWIAGTTELCAGHLVYRDYILDDHGAATGIPGTPYAGPSPGAAPGMVSAGGQRYATGAENTADLVRLDLSLQGEEVAVEFELNTLYAAQQTLAAIAIDRDNNPFTGSEKLLGLSLPGADEVHVFGEGDPASNLIRGRFARPAGTTWKLWAVTAQADGTVMNVAFRGVNETAGLGNGFDAYGKGLQWDDRQAAALQAGDISAFAATVQVADLLAGSTRGMVVPPGFHQRVYTSAYTLPPGEGVSLAGVPGRHGANYEPCEQYFTFLGKYQPYAIYIPNQPGPHGVQMRLHGCGAAPTSEVNQAHYQQRYGEDLNVIIASPLGRGVSGFYSDISERDVLDVLDDVLASYSTDADRVLLGGTSMGGYGTLRFAALYPDRFAAGSNWVGFPGDFFNTPLPVEIGATLATANQSLGDPLPLQSGIGAIGNMMDYTGNLRHVPIVHLYGVFDPLVNELSSSALQLRMAQTPGVEYDFYQHAPAEHVSFAYFDDWQKEAAFNKNRVRVRNPAHIRYRTDAYLDYPEYAIRHDRAYWVSGIQARRVGGQAGEAYSDVEMHSYGCGRSEPQYAEGADAGYGPVGWLRTFRHVTGTTPVPAQNRLEATLNNVAALSIDAAGACLAPGTAYRVLSDGPVTLRFSDGRVLALPAAGTHEGQL